MAYSEKKFEGATHTAVLGDITYYINSEGLQDACDALREKTGLKDQIPSIKRIENGVVDAKPVIEKRADNAPDSDSVPNPDDPPSSPPDTQRSPKVEGGQMNEQGRDRATADRAAAEASGFAPAQALYAIGTQVVEAGVKNSKAKREEFDNMGKVKSECKDVIQKVETEKRSEIVVPLTNIQMNTGGKLVVTDQNENKGKLALEHHAFRQLLTRADQAGKNLGFDLGLGSAGRFLENCGADGDQLMKELRASVINRSFDKLGRTLKGARQLYSDQAKGLDKKRAKELFGKAPTDTVIKLLTRVSSDATGRAAFAAVSPKYQNDYDVAKIAEELAKVVDDDARGTIVYDGHKARFQVLFHSTVQPEDFVAGEFFRAGIQIRTDDTGGGSLIIDSLVWQNLCLNLYIIDQAVNQIDRIRHLGNNMGERFNEGIRAAFASINYFLERWGYATKEDVLARVIESQPEHKAELDKVVSGGLPISVALPGLFNGLLNSREFEKVPVGHAKGEKRQRILGAMVDAYGRDISNATSGKHAPVTRAGIVNAVTRSAHEYFAQSDPWVEDTLQEAAGKLLTPRKGQDLPAPLPYAPIVLGRGPQATA
jgi:hypothetical protein